MSAEHLKPFLKNFAEMTPEERIQMQEKARATREAKKLAAANLRQTFGDERLWRKLFSHYSIKAPSWVIPTSPMYMRRCLRQIGVETADYLEVSGERVLSDFDAQNSNWPCWAWLGSTLEWVAEGILPSSKLAPLSQKSIAEWKLTWVDEDEDIQVDEDEMLGEGED